MVSGATSEEVNVVQYGVLPRLGLATVPGRVPDYS